MLNLINIFVRERTKEQVVTTLFKENYAQVVRYCYHYTHDQDEAADLAQEVFSRLYTSFASIKTKEKIKSYLFTMARNTCISKLREQKKDLAMKKEYQQFRSLDPTDPPLLREKQLQIVEDLVERLSSAKEKEIVQLYYFGEELTTRDIAKQLNLPHGTVTVTLKRVRTKLLKSLVATISSLNEEYA